MTPTTAPTPGAATPGPWRVLGDGVTVAQDRKTHRTHVCRAFEIYGCRAEREANAALIAAAPTTLAALKAMVALWEGVDPDDMPGDVLHALTAARSATAEAGLEERT